MLERDINLPVEQVYAALKDALVKKGCVVLFEEMPCRIILKQGSLWGITPQTAKKTLDFNLEPVDGGTRVTCSSRLASDWKNITVVGCVLAFVLVAFCFWIGADLDAFMVRANPGFWGWLIVAYGVVNYGLGHALASLVWGLAFFLLVIIALEAAVGVYAHVKVERFAEQALNLL